MPGAIRIERSGGDGLIPAQDMALVRASFEAAQPVIHVAADLFHGRLFYLAPSLRRLFAEDMREVRESFVSAMGFVIEALSHPEVLLALLRRLGVRLVGRGVTAAHYSVIGETLIWTLERVLAAAFTVEVERAWRLTYEQLVVLLQRCIDERGVRMRAA